jgi:ribose/xylose/arabinose/galactoside ABC-type transport system permease subunit
VSSRPVPTASLPLDPRLAVRALPVAAAAALAVFAVSTSGFLTVANGQAILLSVAVTVLLSTGLTFITLSGNFVSLSLGATVLGTAALFLASLKFGIVAAILICILGGALVGAIQGAFVGGIGANPIVTTLAASSLIAGLVVGVTHGEAVLPPAGAHSFHALTQTNLIGVPVSAWFALGLVIVAQCVLTWTQYGREVLLVGANRDAARSAGLRTGRVTLIAFAIAGLCAGLGGVLVGARSGQATVGFANTYDFDAITAVVLGGTLVTGGRGAVWRTGLAALALAVLGNVLLLHGMTIYNQLFVKGLIFLGAVSVVSIVRIRKGGRIG